jgi:hypothetical protein
MSSFITCTLHQILYYYSDPVKEYEKCGVYNSFVRELSNAHTVLVRRSEKKKGEETPWNT